MEEKPNPYRAPFESPTAYQPTPDEARRVGRNILSVLFVLIVVLPAMLVGALLIIAPIIWPNYPAD